MPATTCSTVPAATTAWRAGAATTPWSAAPAATLLNGGEGEDTASYAGGARVSVSLAKAGFQNTVGAGSDKLVGIENLGGGSGNDALSGNAHANVLSGEAGKDTLRGQGDDDTLNGGLGNDTLIGGTRQRPALRR